MQKPLDTIFYAENVIAPSTMSRLEQQTTNTVLMVRPEDFCFNEDTAKDNEFQTKLEGMTFEQVNQMAMKEFDESVQILKSHGVNVITTGKSHYAKKNGLNTPDAVFPNNWVSFHKDGTVIQYPMCGTNRRYECYALEDVLNQLESQHFDVNRQVMHLMEEEDIFAASNTDFLESTGVLIFDHICRTVYCALSQRASRSLIEKLQQMTESRYFDHVVCFNTVSSKGKEFYHSNVMMAMGDSFAVICADAIVDNETNTRANVLQQLQESQREVICISHSQAEQFFCGNILQLHSFDEKNEAVGLIVMSESALQKGFTEEQKKQLKKYGTLVGLPVSNTIEKIGGGSARCMICEIFTPKIQQE